MKRLFLLFFIIMNLVTFITVQIDKKKAINGESRIAETRLIAMSSFGAAPGSMIGLSVFNNTTHPDRTGSLWEALRIVLAENVLMFLIVFIRPRKKREHIDSLDNGYRMSRF